MSTSTFTAVQRRQTPRLIAVTVAAIGIAAGALALFSPPAFADQAPVPIPAIPGAPAFPGQVAPAAKLASTIGILKQSVQVGPIGTKFTITGSGLQANKPVSIVWMTSNITWILDARPDSVDYIGRKAEPVGAVIATATTGSGGGFTVDATVPRDYGALHDIYAVIDGVQVAKGGFQVDRQITISPTSGPIGTLVTVKVSGLAASLYGSSESIWYDSKYGGVATALWTRGEASFQIRASGPVGEHLIQAAGGMQFNYLNYQQSPVPWATGAIATFTVTKDNGPPKAETIWPPAVTPTLDKRTTLAAANLAPDTKAVLTASPSSGAVNSKVAVTATGLTPGAAVRIDWSTVVGNRVNCTGTCWTFASIPMGAGTAAGDGTLTSTTVSIPDHLGGWHVIQVVQNGKVMAQTPFYVKRSLYSYPKRVKAGKIFYVHLKGVGWTQLDNTVAVTYDNSYIGYACGFNSNGDVVIPILATGAPGTHLIDLYPLLYTYQPAYPYPPYGMVPFLNQSDNPSLALGYSLPTFRIAVTVVK